MAASCASVGVSFGAAKVDEVSRLVAIAALGMCRALAAGTVSPAYACERLFGPALLKRLEQAGASADLRDAIHLGTELEDIADLIPARLPGAVADIEKQLLQVLAVHKASADAGEMWLIFAPGSCDDP
jgi:hypothetical protein